MGSTSMTIAAQLQQLTAHGAFIVLVGPDGVGKTTIAAALAQVVGGAASYFHYVPPVSGLESQVPTYSSPRPPVVGGRGSRLIGALRLARYCLQFWLGYLGSVRPALRRGRLVIGDRAIYGYLVQPDALKFYGPRGLAVLAMRLLPRPDLVVNLAAPRHVIRARKQELTPERIDRELRDWASLPEPRLVTFDTVEAPAVIAARVLGELSRRVPAMRLA